MTSVAGRWSRWSGNKTLAKLVLAGALMQVVAAGEVWARADPPAAAKANKDAAARAASHADKGRRLYDLRRYDPAIKEFEQAYQLDNDPAHLYNIAQAHRLANHIPEAIAAYEAYLDRLPTAPNRPDIERRIAELRTAHRPPNSLEPQPAGPAAAQPAPPPPGYPAAPAPPAGYPPAGYDHPAPGAGAPLLGDPGATSGYPAYPGHPPSAPYPAQAPAPSGYPPAGPPGQPPAQSVTASLPAGHHSHDGLFLRAQLGAGYMSTSSDNDSELRLRGVSGNLTLAAGVALRGRFVLYGELTSASVTDPEVDVAGVGSAKLDGSLRLLGLGVGGALYLMPANVYFSATLSASQVNLEFGLQDRVSKVGGGLTVSAGKEWWVSRDLALGAAVQLHGSSAKGDEGPQAATINAGWFSLLFSATYN